MKKLTKNVELVPHIVIDPNDYRKSKKRSQSKIKRREKLTYWQQSFKEAGIEDIQPIAPNMWIVRVGNIHHEQIYRNLLAKSWHKLIKGVDNWQSLIAHFDGGLSLIENGNIIYGAMCCSDLTNIKDWKTSANDKNPNWQMLWNGHPWIYIRHQKGDILFSKLCESEPTSLDAGKYAVNHEQFKQIVTQAETELAEFGQRIYEYWSENKDNI